MIDLGTVRPGTTLYIPFHTFDSNDPSASVTITGLATTDIEVYKNGSNTTRASDTGYALLGTDGIDEYGTGIHGFSIDLSSNADAGFFTAGAQYHVVVASITVDAATVNFIAATFRIGYPDAMINTTIATLSTQTSFTLTVGPAEANALIGCPVIIHDIASAVQLGYGVISAYAATTKTVTLAAGTSFTAAAGDNISIFMPSNARWAGSVAWGSGAITAGAIASNAITSAKIAASAIGASQIATDAITAAKIATDAIGAAELAADAASEIGTAVWATAARTLTANTNLNDPTAAAIADQVWDEATAGHATAGTTGKALTDAGSAGDPWATALPGAYGAGTAGKIVGDNIDAPLSTIDTVVDGIQSDLDNGTDGLGAIKADTAATLADTNELQTDDVPGLIAGLNDVSAADVNAQCDTAISDAALATAASIAALNDIAATDIVSGGAITTSGGIASADTKKINGVTITGDGSGAPFDV